MLLPTSALGVWIALLISLIGLGSWTSLYKAGAKKRFELYYYDFTFGALLGAVILAFTLGTLWDPKDLTFQDNWLLAGYRKIAWVLGSSVAFNLGNLMLLAAVSVAGMSVAFPIAFGFAWGLIGLWEWYSIPGSNAMMAFSGSGIVFAASILTMIAYSWHRQELASRTDRAPALDARGRPIPPRKNTAKGVLLAVLSGVFYSLAYPVIAVGVTGDGPLSGYGAALVVAFGMLVSGLLFVPFFLNFPVQGVPLELRQYFTLSMSTHVSGVLAGLLWIAGLLSGLTVLTRDAGVNFPATVSYVLAHAVPLVAVGWGIFIWREFSGTTMRVNMLLAAMGVLLLAGVSLLALSHGAGT